MSCEETESGSTAVSGVGNGNAYYAIWGGSRAAAIARAEAEATREAQADFMSKVAAMAPSCPADCKPFTRIASYTETETSLTNHFSWLLFLRREVRATIVASGMVTTGCMA
jgi:hypothetical protein